MKFSSRIAALVAITVLYSPTAPATRGNTEAGICTDCFVNTPAGPRMKDNMQFVATVITDINKNLKWGPKCNNFASGTELGQWGHYIREDYLKGSYPNLEKGSPDIHRVCPTYSKMKPTDKANFWVLVFNAMANYESTCNKNAPAKGPNGSLYGLMQLHVGKEGAYAKDCSNGDSKYPSDTFSCTFSMLDGQLRRDDALFSRKSYWDVLRPQAKSGKSKKIAKSISAYTPCHDEKRLNAKKRSEFEDNEEIFQALDVMDVPDTGFGIYDI
nr:hypothetical protein BdHM001_10220 [Bdellovibrio sp. HM001]BFD67749.1 hypothetical protein HAGR004_27710 [Bdellovibrio sp. HAGR004]